MTTHVKNPGLLRVGDTTTPTEKVEVAGRIVLESVGASRAASRAGAQILQSHSQRGLIASAPNNYFADLVPAGGVPGTESGRILSNGQVTTSTATTVVLGTILTSLFPATMIAGMQLLVLAFEADTNTYHDSFRFHDMILAKRPAYGTQIQVGYASPAKVSIGGSDLPANPVSFSNTGNDLQVLVTSPFPITWKWFMYATIDYYAP